LTEIPGTADNETSHRAGRFGHPTASGADDESAAPSPETGSVPTDRDAPSERLAPVSPLPFAHRAERADATQADVDDADDGANRDRSSDQPLPQSAARLSLVTELSASQQAEIQRSMERISLEQALLDVEVANARVIDLTGRLVEANQRAAALRAENEELRGRLTQTEAQIEVTVEARAAVLAEREAHVAAQAAHLEAQKASTAYRWAAKVWNLRNAIRN
jgi:hypothetical protein